MPNRILAKIATLKQKLSDIEPELLADTDLRMVFDAEEVLTLQNLKSQACEAGILTTEEGMTVYRLLGGETCMPDHINKQELAERYALTLLLKDLVGMEIARKQG